MKLNKRKLTLLGIALLSLPIAILVGWRQSGRNVESGIEFPRANFQDYTIAYLAEPDQHLVDSLLAPSNLEVTLSANTVSSWPELIGLDRTNAVDAIIIDRSAWPPADSDWLQQVYERGTVVSVFNVLPSELAPQLKDPCISDNDYAVALADQDVDYFISVARHVSGPPDDIALIRKAYQNGACDRQVPGVKGHARVMFSMTTEAITGVSSYNVFAHILAEKLEAVSEAIRDSRSGTD
jgi:hypothetical protein